MHTVDSLFDWFLSATLRGSFLIPAVILVQIALGRKLPAAWRHALWLPVLFVLGSPVLPRRPFRFEQTWAKEEIAPLSVRFERWTAPVGMEDAGAGTAPVERDIDWRHLAAWAWLSGVGLTFASGLVAYRRTLAEFRRRAVVPEDSLVAEIRAAAEECGLRRLPDLVLSAAVPGPAMSGLFRPLLLLPAGFASTYEAEERRLILLHEFTHLKRGDLATNWIVFALQSLHWCNPLVWLAFVRFRADRELACDSAILSSSGEDRRAAYGHVLLKVEAGAAPARHLGFVGLVGLFGRGRVLQSRISAIARHRPQGRLAGVAGLFLFSAFALVGATRAQSEPDPAPARRILIEATFVEVPGDANFEISSTSSSFDPKSGVAVFSSDSDVEEQLAAIPAADLLSAPRVLTLSGQKATIEIGNPGEKGDPKSTGIRFEVLPTLRNGSIDLQMRLQSTQADSESGDGSVAYAEREIQSKVEVRPGDAVLLGAVGKEAKNESGRRLVLAIRTRLVEGEAGLRERLRNTVIPSIEFRETPLPDALAFLRAKSIELDPEKKGVNLVLQGAEGELAPALTLSLREVPLGEALNYVAAVSGLEVTFGDHAVILKKAETSPIPNRTAESQSANPKTAALADKIILPNLELRESPLTDVLTYFQVRSRELDPAKRGLNLILKATGEPAPGSIRITLSLTNIPLSEAMRYVAELSNLKLRYDEEAVVFFRD